MEAKGINALDSSITGHLVDRLIRLAIDEDIGDGDHSSLACIPSESIGSVQLMVKESGILAGMAIAPRVFTEIDPDIVFSPILPDGATVSHGDKAFIAEGRVHSLLRAERIVLNIMQRMSGIATQTAKYVERVAGTGVGILDTRKTNPGMRMLDKMAVRIGGGQNHRVGLWDMIMLKDNHVDFAGGIVNAVERAKNYLNETGRVLPIEVETRSIEEVKQAIAIAGISRIMLDNFTVDETQRAVEFIAGRVEVESSGGITLDTIRDYALTGVNYISLGALTHNISSLDMNLKKIQGTV